MSAHLLRAAMVVICLSAGTNSLWSQETGSSAEKPATPVASERLKLLFSSPSDLNDSWGQLQFGATPVEVLRECGPMAFTMIGSFPLADGTWEVFARDQTAVGDSSMRLIEAKGDEPYDRMTQWKLIRATTRDGVSFENVETVYGPGPAAWLTNFAISYHPGTKEYLLINLKAERFGVAYYAFTSKDGRQWTQHPKPLFYDGDAFSLFYSPVIKRFVCVSKTLQPFRKRLIDHGGPTPSLHDDTLRDRRVLIFRTSVDGRQWEPDVSMADVWNRHNQKGAIPNQYLTTPDNVDPPDLEFYSGNGFWYHDRAYLMVLNYAASALTMRKHGPHLDNEWWVSPDGVHWERPARNIHALAVFPNELSRIEVPPMVVAGKICFRVGHLLLGLPEDRISYVSARSHAEFSTRSFVMPDGELRLNAAIPSTERPFAAKHAYVLASIIDEHGHVIPGFESENCVIQNQNRIDIPLTWKNSSPKQLAGKTVRLRFALRSASIYAVTE